MQQTPIRTEIVQFDGGIDLVSPAMQMKSGSLIDAVNFEPDINGGYKRMAGIERFDGRTRPSDADYYNMAVTITSAVSVGNTVTGATSGATAVVLQVNGTTELIVTKVVGTFVSETLNVGGAPKGTVTTTSLNAGTTPALHAAYKLLAAENYRADIAKPAGSGAIRGVHYYNGDLYCFRDNAGATACVMFKATTSGWTAVTFGREIQFTGAVGQINEADTVTGATSGATGVVKRALLRTGTWTVAGAGTLVFDSVTGAFQSGEALQVAAVTKVTSSTVDTAITLQPGGKFEFINNNFSGTTSTYRMFGCDGVNFAFEFDGTRLVPIRTDITPDAPKYIAAWKNMLVVAVASSVQVSGIGSPYSWTALTGAAELALGDTCTGILPQLGDAASGAIAIFTIDKSYVLYGNSSADFKLVMQSPDAGAQPYTPQNIGFAYYLDTKGIVQINATRAYGNFQLSTLTRLIQPIIDAKRGLVKASCIVRGSNQYRLFFSDGTGIIMYMVPTQPDSGGGVAADAVGGCMYFDYGSTRYMNTVESVVDTTGIERIFASGSDGYVYELNRGTSFDGSNIQSHLMTSFNSSKSPRLRKHYTRTILQATCANTANLQIGYDLSYGTSEVDTGARSTNTLIGSGSYWDIFTWDTFTWDSPYVSEYTIDTRGNGVNLSLVIFGDTNLDEPYTVHSAIINFKAGRLER
jgi:hypothetical protein